MTSSAVVLSVAAAYLVLSLVIGLLPTSKSSDSAVGYVAGDRSLGLLVMYFITGATIFSSFAFLGAPGFAYQKGASVFYILGYGALGFVPFYFLGPRAARAPCGPLGVAGQPSLPAGAGAHGGSTRRRLGRVSGGGARRGRRRRTVP